MTTTTTIAKNIYDKTGKLIEQDHLTNGVVTEKDIYTYNSSGKLSVVSKYDASGKITEVDKYNSAGTIVTEIDKYTAGTIGTVTKYDARICCYY